MNRKEKAEGSFVGASATPPKKPKTKSIKGKIALAMISTVLVLAVAIGSISAFLSYRGTLDTLDQTLSETAQVAADYVSASLNSYKVIAKDIGCIARLANSESSLAQKQNIYEERMRMYDLSDVTIADLSGNTTLLGEAKNISNEEYFKTALKGDSFVSDPMINEKTGKMNIFVGAPLWEGGLSDTKIVGAVVVVFDASVISDVAASIQVGTTGSTYMINQEGNTVAHTDYEMALGQENTIRDAEGDPQLAKLAEIEKRMIAGEAGFDTFTYDGEDEFQSFAPIAGSNGWSIGIYATKSEFFVSTYFGVVVTFVVCALGIIIAAFIAFRLAGVIAGAIKSCADRLTLLANGDLHTPVPTTKAKDETGLLLGALQQTVSDLGGIVGDISNKMGELAGGNFSIEAIAGYKGDFRPIENSMEKIVDSLNLAMGNIEDSATKVTNGSEQISDASKALAYGASEQASSIEELSATIHEISEKINRTAKNATAANGLSGEAGEDMDKGKEKMQEMIVAMDEINKASGEIGKIIKTIDDIAFQTNILALNAAVEAARAGEAGKGFAVVADEVRNLAAKSAEAADTTTALIEGAIKVVGKGIITADETGKSLDAIVEKTAKVTALVNDIYVAANEQAQSLSQINVGVEQISSVVQTNSATSEQSAAAGSELTSQAYVLKELLSKFKLKEGRRNHPASTPGNSPRADHQEYVPVYEDEEPRSFGGSKY